MPFALTAGFFRSIGGATVGVLGDYHNRLLYVALANDPEIAALLKDGTVPTSFVPKSRTPRGAIVIICLFKMIEYGHLSLSISFMDFIRAMISWIGDASSWYESFYVNFWPMSENLGAGHFCEQLDIESRRVVASFVPEIAASIAKDGYLASANWPKKTLRFFLSGFGARGGLFGVLPRIPGMNSFSNLGSSDSGLRGQAQDLLLSRFKSEQDPVLKFLLFVLIKDSSVIVFSQKNPLAKKVSRSVSLAEHSGVQEPSMPTVESVNHWVRENHPGFKEG